MTPASRQSCFPTGSVYHVVPQRKLFPVCLSFVTPLYQKESTDRCGGEGSRHRRKQLGSGRREKDRESLKQEDNEQETEIK